MVICGQAHVRRLRLISIKIYLVICLVVICRRAHVGSSPKPPNYFFYDIIIMIYQVVLVIICGQVQVGGGPQNYYKDKFGRLFGRFEIRNFKTQKWVWMFLSFLVENFFLVILRLKIFFVLQKLKKKYFSVNFSRFYW
jgi:hypothetical protein